MVNKRKSKKEKFDARPLTWALTSIFTIIMSASLFSIFNNQGQVADWIWICAGASIFMLMLLIYVGHYTTNETLAYVKPRR